LTKFLFIVSKTRIRFVWGTLHRWLWIVGNYRFV